MILKFNHVKTDPWVARRLSPELAFRYHALPLTEEEEQITVIMADPLDFEAREVISDALGRPVYIIQGSEEDVDTLIQDVWPQNFNPGLRFLGIVPQESEEIMAYIDSFSNLLGGDVNYSPLPEDRKYFINEIQWASSLNQYDLMLLGDQSQRGYLDKRIRNKSLAKLSKKLDNPILSIQSPRWPIKKILFITRCDEVDDEAGSWVIRIARACSASVTLLIILPQLPIMYQQMGIGQPTPGTIISSETASGIWLRKMTDRMDLWGVPGEIRVRQGDPELQFCQEMNLGDYDLVALSPETKGLPEWFSGSILPVVLNKAERPVLIAKNSILKSEGSK